MWKPFPHGIAHFVAANAVTVAELWAASWWEPVPTIGLWGVLSFAITLLGATLYAMSVTPSRRRDPTIELTSTVSRLWISLAVGAAFSVLCMSVPFAVGKVADRYLPAIHFPGGAEFCLGA